MRRGRRGHGFGRALFLLQVCEELNRLYGLGLSVCGGNRLLVKVVPETDGPGEISL
jgi:hypothetical protein